MTAISYTMADVVLDANVLVGLLDGRDVLATRASELVARLQASGSRAVLLGAEEVSAWKS